MPQSKDVLKELFPERGIGLIGRHYEPFQQEGSFRTAEPFVNTECLNEGQLEFRAKGVGTHTFKEEGTQAAKRVVTRIATGWQAHLKTLMDRMSLERRVDNIEGTLSEIVTRLERVENRIGAETLIPSSITYASRDPLKDLFAREMANISEIEAILWDRAGDEVEVIIVINDVDFDLQDKIYDKYKIFTNSHSRLKFILNISYSRGRKTQELFPSKRRVV